VACCGTHKRIRSSTLSLLSRHFAYLYGDVDPANRGEISSITTNLILRLKRSSLSLSRAIERHDLTLDEREKDEYELKQHKRFFETFVAFLGNELGPTCSFPRHIGSLKALLVLAKSGIDPLIKATDPPRQNQESLAWPFEICLSCPSIKQSLWPLLIDPFEEVRAIAMVVFESISPSSNLTTDCTRNVTISTQKAPRKNHNLSRCRQEEIARYVENANRLAALSNRADHADGLGRLLRLQYLSSPKRALVLSSALERLCRASKLLAANTSPPSEIICLHGHLAGLRYLLDVCGLSESADGLMVKETCISVQRVLEICYDVWHAVRDDLCVDTPEFSREIDLAEPFEGPKDFLSYSWRALRDSSLLLQTLLLQLKRWMDRSDTQEVRVDHLRSVYCLCFEQLTVLRHRGAFSTVAQTFALCCELSAHVPSLQTDTKRWYQVGFPRSQTILVSSADPLQEAFQILEAQSSTLTRRSAGIPAIIAGLLVPSPSTDFNEVGEKLKSLARSKENVFRSQEEHQQDCLPQVHALNCLRELATDSRFRARTLPWLIDLLDISSSSLGSPIWAIRNCGLMLFRATANRISTTATLSERSVQSDDRHASGAILDIAFQLLGAQEEANPDSEVVFVGLDLLNHVSPAGDDQVLMRQRISTYLGSPVWMIREHAARVHAFHIVEVNALEAIIELLGSMDLDDQNKCHGLLLCSRELLEKHASAALDWSDTERIALETRLQQVGSSLQRHAAPAVRCGYLNLANAYIKLQNQPGTPFLTWCSHGLNLLDERDFRIGFQSRVQSQLRASWGLNRCLLSLFGVQETSNSLIQIVENVTGGDPNAAVIILEGLRDQVASNRDACRLMIELFVGVICSHDDELAIATALFGLSSSLEANSNRETGPTLMAESELPILLKRVSVLSRHGSRDFCNAAISGLGSILTRGLQETPTVLDDTLLSEAFTLWITMLKRAATDMTESPTRLNAVQSLYFFRQCMTNSCVQISMKGKMALCFILYDLLDDDDQEIRDLAASTASFILTAASSSETLQLCPAAASSTFSTHQTECFGGQNEFHWSALSRLMFSHSDIVGSPEEFKALSLRYAVEYQLELSQRASYDLFEEERQNLYLDDVREIEIWHAALSKISASCIDAGLIALVQDWTLGGLRQLTAALSDISSGPFGTLSKGEMVTLIFRIIQLADLSIQWDLDGDMGVLPRQAPLHLCELERLVEASRRLPLQNRAQMALEESVRKGRAGVEQLQLQ
jgi:hypothetical protein